MLSEKAIKYGMMTSPIEEIYKYGQIRKKKIGVKKVYDFSLEANNVLPPKIVNRTIFNLLNNIKEEEIHQITQGEGDYYVRHCIVTYLNQTYKVHEKVSLIYITQGINVSLSIVLNALVESGDEVIVLSPSIPDYKMMIEKAGARIVYVPCNTEDFIPDIELVEKAIHRNTKAIIINTPNNPTGVVYPEIFLENLNILLEEKGKEYKKDIFLISDERYRDFVYDEDEILYVAKYVKNTISCYSFSDLLAIPGEQLGYICVSNKMKMASEVFDAVKGSAKLLGISHTNSLFQLMIPEVLGDDTLVRICEKNRNILYSILTRYGFNVIYPKGSFFLFIEVPNDDTEEFLRVAKRYDLLFIDGEVFGEKGFVRATYNVNTYMIEKAEGAIKKLSKEFF